jgi:glyoxylase-like metal-dependent hydrolase (beta-lactamase superfamily II)
MHIRAFQAGPLNTIGYLAYGTEGGQAIMIDAPPGCAARVKRSLQAASLELLYVVDTHGHWDHVADNVALAEGTGAKICAHTWDATRLANPTLATEGERPYPVQPSRADISAQDGGVLEVGGLNFEVLHTPGHTPGSICLYEAAVGALFSGDTLQRGRTGRTDFAGGDARRLSESLGRLAGLPDVVRVFPGHGAPTTIGEERWLLELAIESVR